MWFICTIQAIYLCIIALEELALELLTHDKDVPYMEYAAKIKLNPVATAVKLEDLHRMKMTIRG